MLGSGVFGDFGAYRGFPGMLTRTTTRLIEDLKDPANTAAWSAFDERYRPVLVAFGRKLGLGADDAGELAQRTLAEFSEAFREGRYERGRGRLSSWLIGMGRNFALEMHRRNRGHGGGHAAGGGSVVENAAAAIPDGEQLTRVWQREREQVVFAQAMTMLSSSTMTDERTLKAFELFALRGVPAEEVARECGMEVATVYVVKNRLTKRLRELVRELTSAYDEDE